VYILQGDGRKKAGNDKEAMEKYNLAIETLNGGISNLDSQKDISDEDRIAYASDLNQVLLNAYIAADRLGEAEDIFKKNADTRTDDAVAQFNYGTILLQKEDFEGAVKYLDRAININPEYKQALQNISAAYLRWGYKMRDEESMESGAESNYKDVIRKAIPHIEKLIELSPSEAAIFDLAAKIYASVGNNDKANEMFKKADELRNAEESE
jgi:tetratricopeptide (TPR) repeat protein